MKTIDQFIRDEIHYSTLFGWSGGTEYFYKHFTQDYHLYDPGGIWHWCMASQFITEN